jgi:uncharacterized membrane protein
MVRKSVKRGKSVKGSSKSKNDKSVSGKLDKILNAENRLLKIEKDVESKEEKLMSEERRVELEEKKIESEEEGIAAVKTELDKEESDIAKLEKIEEEIKKEVGEHPLARVTLKDISKGMIGAFVGLAIHYTFTYGVEIAAKLTMTRATILFPVTFLVGLLFIYATGFRKIEDKKLLLYMPLRLGVLYICSLIVSIGVLFLFYPEFGQNFVESYKMVAGVMLAAVVGACTADLLGKE